MTDQTSSSIPMASSSSSSMPPPKDKVDVMGRKIWDKAHFRQRAELRDEQEEDGSLLDDVKYFGPDGGGAARKADYPAPSERKALQRRTEEVRLDSEIGKTLLVTTQTPKQLQGGYWCETCSCLIKDSQAYLDHINGKKHNRMLGMTMRVERVGVGTVKHKLNQLKKKQARQEEAKAAEGLKDGMGGDGRKVVGQQIEDRLADLRQQETERREKRREKKKLKRKQQALAAAGGTGATTAAFDSDGVFVGEQEEEEEEDEGVDVGEKRRRLTADQQVDISNDSSAVNASSVDDIDTFVLSTTV
eukprot:GHVS01038705.1.p1 GENE.GHVS01038705.1~~GHVS01038705.1.p1  ORF type:complete len:302 (+),score=95.17 GHVS01038705.1:196-1101(+)